MKKYSLIALIALAAACQPNDESLEAKKTKLSEKEQELNELKAEISTLEEEIATMDTTTNLESKTPVEVKAIEQESFSHFVKLTGTVTSKENIMISAEATGRVESIPAEEGQKVSKGTVLVRLNNDQVRNQLQEAKASYELAETTYQKRKKLWDQKIGSEIEYLQAKNQYETTKSRYAQVRDQYDNTVIKAPINGSVDDISVKEGEYVNMGSPIVRVVDLKNVEIEAELSEDYLPNVKKGDSVRVNIPSLGVERMAPVEFVSQVINPENRSFKIKINLPNADGSIKPNVIANLMIRDYANDSALVVPSRSINKDLKGDYVYVAQNGENGLVAAKKYIKRGRSFGDKTEIKDGLQAGDKVITAGFNQVNEGERITLN